MQLNLIPDVPYPASKIILDAYLKVFKRGEFYDAYSIDQEYNIIKGKGFIEEEEIPNYHQRTSDKKDVLRFIKSGKKAKESIDRWWTISLEEVTTLQHDLITQALLKLKEVEVKLEQLKNQEL